MIRRRSDARVVALLVLLLAACGSHSAMKVDAGGGAPPLSDGATADRLADLDPGADVPRCVAGNTVTCACADGSSGLQTCETDGTYGACGCACVPGRSIACTCGARNGARVCLADGNYGDCVCAQADAGSSPADLVPRSDSLVSLADGPSADLPFDLPRDSAWPLDLSAADLGVDAKDALSPDGFTYTVADKSDPGVVYFLDGTNALVRRFDIPTRTFLPPLPVDSSPTSMAVEPEGSVVYVGYSGGRMEVVEVGTGARRLFGVAPETVSLMLVADRFLFTIDSSGSWDTRSLFDRASGTRVFADDWRESSYGGCYDPVLRTIFTLRDGTSPNDIITNTVDVAQGTLGSDVDSPYHGDYVVGHPLRLTPDRSRVFVSSGVSFYTADLKYAGAIGFSYVDLRFYQDRVYLLDAAASGTVRLRTLDSGYSVLDTETWAGTPLLLYVHGNELVSFTRQNSRIVYAIKNLDVSGSRG
jgi:hypothetical protein